MTPFDRDVPVTRIANKSKIYSKRGLQEIIRLLSHSPKKSLGQHYLYDKNVLEKIVDTALRGLEKDLPMVMEIGSGLGGLTWTFLKRGVRVLSLEIEHQLVDFLRDYFHDELASSLGDFHRGKKSFYVEHADFLRGSIADWLPLIKKNQTIILISNLPYQSTSPILFKSFSEKKFFTSMTFVMQKEVADRIKANPSSKTYGILSILSRYYMDIQGGFSISASCFYPEPKVDSALLHLVQPVKTLTCLDESFFHRLVRAAFNHRRKKIFKSILTSSLIEVDQQKLAKAFEVLDQNSPDLIKRASTYKNLRAEDLSLQNYLDLVNAYCKM